MTNLLVLVVMLACVRVEGNPSGGPADSGKTVGHLCISRQVVIEVNRHYGTCYTFAQMRNRRAAEDVFIKYAKKWRSDSPEQIARRWNGGPRGMRKPETLRYWRKVSAVLREPAMMNKLVEAMTYERYRAEK